MFAGVAVSSKIFAKSNVSHFSKINGLFMLGHYWQPSQNHSLDAKFCAESNGESLIHVRCTIAKILCMVIS